MDILDDYCRIFAEPAVRRSKKEKRKQLEEWRRQPYGSLPDFRTLSGWLSGAAKGGGTEITWQLAVKVIFPVCDAEIFQKNNGEAMKLLLCGLPDSLAAEQKFMSYKNGHSFDLLDMALRHAPDDRQLLRKRYERETRFYSSSIHEVPAGVLCGTDGASLGDTREMLAGLEEYRLLCEKLGILNDSGQLIETCSSVYTLWIEFLSNSDRYESFAHCLKMHGTTS